MRTEREMTALILGVAERDARVRAVFMNGSRANPNAPRDIFQDYDIVYVVEETASFRAQPGWVDVFGERLVMQTPDEMDHAAGQPTDLARCYGYLMQFADGNRIDLRLMTLPRALEECQSDSQTIVLLDKDGILPPLPLPSDTAYTSAGRTRLRSRAAATSSGGHFPMWPRACGAAASLMRWTP